MSQVGVRIPGRGSSLCKGTEAGLFLGKWSRPVWLESGREVGTRRKRSCWDFDMQGQRLGRGLWASTL